MVDYIVNSVDFSVGVCIWSIITYVVLWLRLSDRLM